MSVMINNYLIDAFLTEEHTYESDVTEYPVESGANITDNIRPKPIRVNITGIVSDTPLEPIASARAKQTSTTNSDDLEFLPSDDALAMLEAVWLAREPVPLDTTLKHYDNMAMSSLVIPRDAETGAALGFTATFQQVRIITNNRATIKVSPPAGTGLGGNKKKKKAATEWVGKDGSTMAWHHYEPSPPWSVTELVGWNQDDAKAGGVGFVHGAPSQYAGQPLTQAEAVQMSKDNRLYSQTHDSNGNVIGHVVTGGANAGEVEREPQPNEVPASPGDSRHSTEPQFRQSDGQWVDEEGHPVAQDPTTGNWAHTTAAPPGAGDAGKVNGIPKSGG
jgi:hypothetical protein